MLGQNIIPGLNLETQAVVTYSVVANGTPLANTTPVNSIYVQKEVNKIPVAVITIFDGNPANQDFEILGGNDLVPGVEIELLATYGTTDQQTIFKGIVTKVKIKHLKNRTSYLEVECRDEAVRLTVGKKNQFFRGDGETESTDSDAISEVLGPLAGTITPTTVSYRELVQYFSTDWDFVVTRAEANSRVIIVNDGVVDVIEPSINALPTVSANYGFNIFEFNAEIDARDQFSSITGRSWDQSGAEIIEEDASVPEPPAQGGNLSSNDLADVIGLETYLLQHSGNLQNTELQAWANAKMLKSRLSKIKGTVKILGTAAIKVGDTLELAGVGDRFNGNVYISGIRQEINDGVWYTLISFGLDFEWFSEKAAIKSESSGGLLPSVNGLHIGVVTQIEEDPDSEERVLVRLPVVDPEVEGLWARVAQLDAGLGADGSRGIVFHPEVGDEVIVGFINDDPRDPIILGKLFSSNIPSPIPATADNFEKGIVTREGIKLTFNDEVKSVTLETPNANTLVISDEEAGITLTDENGNTVVMNADGITIESASDLNLKASGDVNIEGTAVNLTGTDVTVDGTNTTLSAGASMTIEGSIVQIN